MASNTGIFTPSLGSSINLSETNQTTEQATQGGNAAAQTGGSAVTVSTLGNVAITQESPQAISALQNVADNALSYGAQLGAQSLGIASNLAGATRDALGELSATPARQLQNALVPILLVGAIIFFIVKKG